MANAFNQAREENLAAGTMSKGKIDQPQQPRVAAPAQSAAAPALTGKLYAVNVDGRNVIVQADTDEIEDLREFIESTGLDYTITPIQLMKVEFVKAAVLFNGISIKPKKSNRKTTKRRVRTPVRSNDAESTS